MYAIDVTGYGNISKDVIFLMSRVCTSIRFVQVKSLLHIYYALFHSIGLLKSYLRLSYHKNHNLYNPCLVITDE